MAGRVAPMTDTLFLISGASGQVGRHLVAQLIESGHRVRALTRSPEKADLPAAAEVVTGSFDHLPEGVFDGVTAAFVFPADGAADFARAAAASGVPRLVLLSSLAAALEHGRELTFTEQSPEEFAAEMAQYGVSADIVTMLLNYWSDTVTEPDVPRPPDGLIGRPARTLAEWARDHAAEFGG